MRLTAKGRYAVTAMLDLVVHQREKKPVALADISRRQDISLAYLEQLFAKLRKNGLVLSFKGPGGGYSLARSPQNLFVSEIVDSVDENVDATKCSGKGNCQHGEMCLTHELWSDLSHQIREYLSRIDLASLTNKGHFRRVISRQRGVEGQILMLDKQASMKS